MAPVLWSTPPFAGDPAGAELGGVDGTADGAPVGATLGASAALHPTITNATAGAMNRDASRRRWWFGMACRTPVEPTRFRPSADPRFRSIPLYLGTSLVDCHTSAHVTAQKGLDGARIFSAMSARARPGRTGRAPPQPRARPTIVRQPTAGSIAIAASERGGSGEGVPGPYADLSRLCGGVHLLGRRAGLLRQQESGQRPAAVSVVSRCGQASAEQRGTARVPCSDLRRLWGPGRRAVRATQRSTGVLQLVLRQGASGDARNAGARVINVPAH